MSLPDRQELTRAPRLAAYVYPGWHPTAERDEAFHPGFTEWELLRDASPHFEGHAQPRVPLLGSYDDRDPLEVSKRCELAVSHGIDAFIWGFFWCRGKRVFQDALDLGYLGSPLGQRTPFAIMWANRMPRRILPVRRADLPVIAEGRRVSSDVLDFERMITLLADQYFYRGNYLCVEGRPYFSIFDTTFFCKELGFANAQEALRRAKSITRDRGLGELHIAAIDPSQEWAPKLRDIGFDSVTHYVHLPVWKGPALQDYRTSAQDRSLEWPDFARRTALPYLPSVATGWDATPRAADFGPKRPDKYPWSPVVTGDSPALFGEALRRASRFAIQAALEDPLTFVASLNEWTEGHYLEPDERFGNGMLEALKSST